MKILVAIKQPDGHSFTVSGVAVTPDEMAESLKSHSSIVFQNPINGSAKLVPCNNIAYIEFLPDPEPEVKP